MEEPTNEKPKKAPKKQPPAKAKKPAVKPKLPKNNKKSKPVDLSALSALFLRTETLTETLAEQRRRKNTDLLTHQTKEFLSSFIVIGYNLEGEQVNITYASCEKDYDALSTGLQKYIFESMYKNRMPPGNL